MFWRKKQVKTTAQKVSETLKVFTDTAATLEKLAHEAEMEATICQEQANRFLEEARNHRETACTASKAAKRIREIVGGL